MPRRDSERTCIVTRAAQDPARLIRFAAAPDGALVADLRARLPGRGAWVTGEAGLVAKAVEKKLFARALKREVTVRTDLVAALDQALLAEARQALSLANKAGAVLSGFAKVESAIAAGQIAALVHASEAAEDGKRKLAGALRKRLGGAISALPVVTEFSGQELDLALGRSNVIHAALLAGPGSDGFLERWRRLRFYRGLDGCEAGPLEGLGETRIAAVLQGQDGADETAGSGAE